MPWAPADPTASRRSGEFMSEVAATGIASEAAAAIDGALARLEEHAHQQTDGIWLEEVTTDVAPHVRDWNVDRCWRWEDWPDRDEVMPEGTPAVDAGIDLVARRRDDRGWIAIQVKSRKLNLAGEGERVTSDEMNKFLAAAADRDIWAERWLVVNGAVPLGGHTPGKVAMSGAPVKVVNVAQAVESQRAALAAADEEDSGGASMGPPPPRRRAQLCSERRSRRRWNACERTSRPMRRTSREARPGAASCCPAAPGRHVSLCGSRRS